MCIKKEIRDMYFLTYCLRGGKIIKIIHLFVLYGFLYIRHFFPFRAWERVGYIAGEKGAAPVSFTLKVKSRFA